MNLFRYGKRFVNVDNVAYFEIDSTVVKKTMVNISFVGDGADADWGLTLYEEEADAFIEYAERLLDTESKGE